MQGVTAILVNYYTRAFLPAPLTVLEQETAIREVLLVDNSQESNWEDFLNPYTKVRLIEPCENLGFGRAVNLAVRQAQADYFLILNPDTIPSSGFVEKLLEASEEEGAFLAGPRFFWDEQRTLRLPPAMGYSLTTKAANHAGSLFETDWKLAELDWINRFDRFWSSSSPFREAFLSGACLFVKNDPSFIGEYLFDPRFFLYYEETDLCLRALRAGKKTIVVPQAEVIHFWNQSPSNQKDSYMEASEKLFMDKHYGGASAIKIPPFPGNSPSVAIRHLGIQSSNIEFRAPKSGISQKYLFEIGVSPLFNIFFQACVVDATYQLPDQVWDRLAPGTYFSRIRAIDGFYEHVWQWTKS